MQLCVLGSGSSGNTSVLAAHGRGVLIDAGFGPRSVAKKLSGLGITLDDLDAIVLTHLDRDHFAPTWLAAALKRRIRIYCHERHVYAMYAHRGTVPGVNARRLYREKLLEVFDDRPFDLSVGSRGMRVRPVHLAHDRTGTVGFRIDCDCGRLGFATDLGHVPEDLIPAFADVDLLAIESNYDPPMQRHSPRPAMLKRRIMGGAGHLSNAQAFDAIRAIIDASQKPPAHVVLLHLSRQCNAPEIVRSLYTFDPPLAQRLCITTQHHPTTWLAARGEPNILAGQQLDMWS